jgi:hypothetical protein
VGSLGLLLGEPARRLVSWQGEADVAVGLALLFLLAPIQLVGQPVLALGREFGGSRALERSGVAAAGAT